MTTAAEVLRPARDAGAPASAAAEALVARSAAWRGVFDAIDAAVLEQLAAIERDDDVDAALGLMGGDGSATGARLVGHRLGQLSERCVEAVTFDGLFARPASELVPLWRAVCEASGDPALAGALAGDDPAAGVDAAAADRIAGERRPLGEARFEPPADAMWAPVERVIIAGVDADLEHRFGHPVDY